MSATRPPAATKRRPRLGLSAAGWLVASLALGSCAASAASLQDHASIQGSWRAQEYHLKDGTKHSVDGLIVFTQTDWMVLFFVVADDGTPKRGSAEGGRYELRGAELTFFHHYHLSSGEEMLGLEAAPLRMAVRDASQAPNEPCEIDLAASKLTIRFPSGNAMSFVRSSD